MIAELGQLKHDGETVAEELTYLVNVTWQLEDVPGDWRRGVIVQLPNKGGGVYQRL